MMSASSSRLRGFMRLVLPIDSACPCPAIPNLCPIHEDVLADTKPSELGRMGQVMVHQIEWSGTCCDPPGPGESAHNPKVAGSNPAPATKKNPWDTYIPEGFLASGMALLNAPEGQRSTTG